MKRLIKKSSLPTGLDLSGKTVNITLDQPLGEDFAYKVEQAYSFVETIKDVSDIIKTKRSLDDSDYHQLEGCLDTFNSLDQNSFSQIPGAIDHLSDFLSLSKEYDDMWNEYQQVGMEASQKSKNGEDVEDLKQRVNELGQKLFNDDIETKKNNDGVFFTQYFQKVSPEAISKIYNNAGEYYGISFDESIVNTTDINEFIDYCSQHVSSQPQEVQMSRSTYVKDYLLKDVLGDSYDSYINALNTYLNASNSDALTELANITLSNPDLMQLNSIIAGNANEVYRGLSFSSEEDPDYQEIINTGQVYADGISRFVSTSKIKSVAKNFATSNGGAGILLTIQPGTIIYSSDLAGGVFGEGELIIDMQNSVISNIEEV